MFTAAPRSSVPESVTDTPGTPRSNASKLPSLSKSANTFPESESGGISAKL